MMWYGLILLGTAPVDRVDAAATFFVPLLLLFACVFYALRFRWVRRKRRGDQSPGHYPTYSLAGNAFQELQKLTQPRTEYVLREKHTEKVDQDDAGGPKNPNG